MITATVGDLFDDTLKDIVRKHVRDELSTSEPLHEIYVVRDGETVLYVGQSKDPVKRLQTHVGRGPWGFDFSSKLGPIIYANLPESRMWTIELWTVQECKKRLANETNKTWRWDKSLAEKAMIRERRPCLNIVNNPNKRRLPNRYYGLKGLEARLKRITEPPEDLIDYG